MSISLSEHFARNIDNVELFQLVVTDYTVRNALTFFCLFVFCNVSKVLCHDSTGQTALFAAINHLLRHNHILLDIPELLLDRQNAGYHVISLL